MVNDNLIERLRGLNLISVDSTNVGGNISIDLTISKNGGSYFLEPENVYHYSAFLADIYSQLLFANEKNEKLKFYTKFENFEELKLDFHLRNISREREKRIYEFFDGSNFSFFETYFYYNLEFNIGSRLIGFPGYEGIRNSKDFNHRVESLKKNFTLN